MSKPSLIQLSAFDPQMAIPKDSPLAGLANKGAESARTKTASAPEGKKQEILRKFFASTDPKERMRLLDAAMKV